MPVRRFECRPASEPKAHPFPVAVGTGAVARYRKGRPPLNLTPPTGIDRTQNAGNVPVPAVGGAHLKTVVTVNRL